MKKIFKKLISLLTLCIFCCSISASHLYTEANNYKNEIKNEKRSYAMSSSTSSTGYNSSLYLKENYATRYFMDLKTNFGYNVKGSCTYIALGMLLSFYDTYWDDTIIPENYDMITMMSNSSINSVESPGIYTENTPIAYEGISTETYYQNVEQYSNAHFHLKLIQMGKEQFGQYKFDDNTNPCGLLYEELYELTDYYLYDYLGWTVNKVSIVTSETENMNVRQFTISMIQNGFPVILRAGHWSGLGGHAVVAYDYDSTHDKIFVHAGWREDENGLYVHNDIYSLGFTELWDATAIVINDEHSTCSNNFKYSKDYTTLETYCPCLNCSVSYNNLNYKGENGYVLVDNLSGNYAPTTYMWFRGLSLNNIEAVYDSESAYAPQLLFLGWYKDENLTQPITEILPYTMGPINLYAKWRCDYDTVTRTGTKTITGNDIFNQPYDQIYIGMNSNSNYEYLKSVNINYLAITFKINMWEVDDGYQDIYFYGSSNNSNLLTQIYGIEHGGVGTETEPSVFETTLYIDIDDLENVDTLYIRYGAHGNGSNTWKNNQLYMELMFVVDQTDINALEFFWKYKDPHTN